MSLHHLASIGGEDPGVWVMCMGVIQYCDSHGVTQCNSISHGMVQALCYHVWQSHVGICMFESAVSLNPSDFTYIIMWCSS